MRFHQRIALLFFIAGIGAYHNNDITGVYGAVVMIAIVVSFIIFLID